MPKKSRKILLLEPGYRNKYPPLGLMKIARYHREKGDEVFFAKGENDKKLDTRTWDRIYITTLFSFEWKNTEKCIDKALKLAKPNKIFVGGISASLMTEEFQAQEKWKGIRFIQGILKDAPAVALKLKKNEYGHGDNSQPIDELVPDYDILRQVSYDYPVYDAYFGYASRGCVRKCAFCGVPKLEGEQRIMPSLHNLVGGINDAVGEKKDLVLMDNNITAAPNFHEVMAEIRDLGFEKGAMLKRDGKRFKRRVDFNQGVDSRILSKNPNLMKEFSTICLSPLRIAFDHLGVRKHYEIAMHQAADNGLRNLSNYMLYNFMDTPKDLYARLTLNIELNEKLGIKIWSFPMRYQPINLKDRSHIGKHWNRYYLRSFQVMLQATHGVVSGSTGFFNFAYGESFEEFQKLLLLPHEFIFNRSHYFTGAGKPTLDEYDKRMKKLSESEKEELTEWLCSENRTAVIKAKSHDGSMIDSTLSASVKKVTEFYIDHHKSAKIDIDAIFKKNRTRIRREEKVEDAGLVYA